MGERKWRIGKGKTIAPSYEVKRKNAFEVTTCFEATRSDRDEGRPTCRMTTTTVLTT